jgi:hypothetical protein
MSKFKYTATFSDGTVITRSSHRDYKFAWIIRYRHLAPEYVAKRGEFSQRTGFAASKALAFKALASCRYEESEKHVVALEEVADAICPGPKLLEDVLNAKR